MQYCYCLFCETRKCKEVAYSLERSGVDCAFSPQIVKRQRKKGENVEIMLDLLPGYVFAFTRDRVEDISLFRVDGVIRLLGFSEVGYCLIGDDMTFALGLLARKGIIDAIKLVSIGDRIKLADDLFYGCEGEIVQIDYRKQRAKVVFSFGGSAFSSWISCDVIDSAGFFG